jgi:hypothetical protein
MSYKLTYKNKSVDLPDFGTVPAGVLRRARHLDEQEQSWFILEEMLDEKQLAMVDSLPLAEFAKHMKAWTGGVALGES